MSEQHAAPLSAVIASELKLAPRQVEGALALFDEGNTLPFIARYRKEATGGLDEIQLRLFRQANRLIDRHDADLLPFGADQADLGSADLTIDSVGFLGRGNETWTSTAIRQMTSLTVTLRGRRVHRR